MIAQFVTLAQRIGGFIASLTKREPTDQLADESGEFGCNLCSDTGWVLCKCSDPCTCTNYGEMRCPKGCAES